MPVYFGVSTISLPDLYTSCLTTSFLPACNTPCETLAVISSGPKHAPSHSMEVNRSPSDVNNSMRVSCISADVARSRFAQ